MLTEKIEPSAKNYRRNEKSTCRVGVSIWLCGTVAFLLLVSTSALAQATATILGVVKDSSGAVVPGAKVIVVNTGTNDTRTETTDGGGSFRFPALDTGHYSVKIERQGFKSETETGLTLEVAQELVINPVLAVGSASEEVSVTADQASINTTNSSLGGIVGERKMADLPLNGRNYSDLTFLHPGVSVASNISQSSQAGGGHGTYITSDGTALRANAILLDGASVLNGRGGATANEAGASLGVAGIKEFKVVTGTFDASYGNAPGAQVIMVSKNGTNQFHGELFEFIRNQHLDAANYFDVPVAANNFQRIPLFIRNNFGAAGGGPIKRNKTFFYAAYEGLRVRTGGTIIDTVPGAGCHGPSGNNSGLVTSAACPQLGAGAPPVVIAPVMSALLALYPVPNLPNNQFTYPVTTPTTVDWGQIRVDQNISASDTIFGRYTVDQSNFVVSGTNATSIAGSGFPQFLSGFTSRDTFVTASWNHIFSPVLLSQFRFAYTRANSYEFNVWPVNSYAPNGQAGFIGPQYSFVPNTHVGSIAISGYSTMGPNNNDPQGEIDNRFAFTDDVFYTKGKHGLKFGASIIKFNNHTVLCGSCAGQATFTSIGTFLGGIANSTTAIQPNASYIRNWMYWVPGFYGQDDWRVSSRLTLNLGLRYEWMTIPWDADGHNQYLANLTDPTFTQGPIYAPLPKTNFSPRIGAAWDVMGDGKTAVRGGFGSYYDVAGMLIWLQSTESEPPYNANNTHVGNALITIPFTFLPTDVQGIGAAYHDYKNARYLKWNVTVDRQLPWNTGLSVSYVGTRGIHMWQYMEGNPTTPSGMIGAIPYWTGKESRINPAFSSNSMGISNTWETYDGMQVGVNKSLSQGIQFQASYTWSHNMDTVYAGSGVDCVQASGMSQGLYFGPTPGFSGDQYDKGPSCADVRNVFRFNALYHLPKVQVNNGFANLLANGWWMGGIWSEQGGYAFTPLLGTNRSQSQVFKTGADRVNVVTDADVTFCQTNACQYTPVPFNSSKVKIGKVSQWFNPAMFNMAPMQVTPGGAICTAATCATTKYGTLGDAQRGLLRGPGLANLDFSLNKDTHVKWLGEAGNLQFRAEAFNIFNHPNFGMPNGTVFSGGTTSFSPESLAPSSSAGQISSTVNTSRQLQFALKILF
jgi:hypothetical protein